MLLLLLPLLHCRQNCRGGLVVGPVACATLLCPRCILLLLLVLLLVAIVLLRGLLRLLLAGAAEIGLHLLQPLPHLLRIPGCRHRRLWVHR